jgi:hypothetical protein
MSVVSVVLSWHFGRVCEWDKYPGHDLQLMEMKYYHNSEKERICCELYRFVSID